jgi:hypothetical protein
MRKGKNTYDANHIRNFTVWYQKNKDTKEVKEFLVHLREVTGIYSPDDLIKKYKK